MHFSRGMTDKRFSATFSFTCSLSLHHFESLVRSLSRQQVASNRVDSISSSSYTARVSKDTHTQPRLTIQKIPTERRTDIEYDHDLRPLTRRVRSSFQKQTITRTSHSL